MKKKLHIFFVIISFLYSCTQKKPTQIFKSTIIDSTSKSTNIQRVNVLHITAEIDYNNIEEDEFLPPIDKESDEYLLYYNEQGCPVFSHNPNDSVVQIYSKFLSQKINIENINTIVIIDYKLIEYGRPSDGYFRPLTGNGYLFQIDTIEVSTKHNYTKAFTIITSDKDIRIESFLGEYTNDTLRIEYLYDMWLDNKPYKMNETYSFKFYKGVLVNNHKDGYECL